MICEQNTGEASEGISYRDFVPNHTCLHPVSGQREDTRICGVETGGRSYCPEHRKDRDR